MKKLLEADRDGVPYLDYIHSHGPLTLLAGEPIQGGLQRVSRCLLILVTVYDPPVSSKPKLQLFTNPRHGHRVRFSQCGSSVYLWDSLCVRTICRALVSMSLSHPSPRICSPLKRPHASESVIP